MSNSPDDLTEKHQNTLSIAVSYIVAQVCLEIQASGVVLGERKAVIAVLLEDETASYAENCGKAVISAFLLMYPNVEFKCGTYSSRPTGLIDFTVDIAVDRVSERISIVMTRGEHLPCYLGDGNHYAN